MDGKHICIKCPNLSGSNYYSYKGFGSMVLIAICDSKCCFILHDKGQFSSNNDSNNLVVTIPNKIRSSLAHSRIPDLIENNILDIPSLSTYKSSLFNPLPYIFIGDEIFPLKTWFLRSFPGKLNEIFNYRLSRSRRTIENTSGIVVAR